MKFMSVVNAGVTITAVAGLLAVIGHQEQENVRLKKKLESVKRANRILTRTFNQNVDLLSEEQAREVNRIFRIERAFENLAERNS